MECCKQRFDKGAEKKKLVLFQFDRPWSVYWEHEKRQQHVKGQTFLEKIRAYCKSILKKSDAGYVKSQNNRRGYNIHLKVVHKCTNYLRTQILQTCFDVHASHIV